MSTLAQQLFINEYLEITVAVVTPILYFDHSMSSNLKEYWNTVFDKDTNQETNNPYILARRQLASGKPPTNSIILKLLSIVAPKLPILFDKEMEELKQIKSFFPISLDNDIAKSRDIIRTVIGTYKRLANTKRKVGISIFTNLITGEQLVGSSLNLSERLISYLRPSHLNSNRQIGKNIAKYGLGAFRLYIFIIQEGYSDNDVNKVLAITLALEQYYIFTLNSTLNTLKVARTVPITPQSEEGKAKVKLANSNSFLILLDDKPIFFCLSSAYLIKLTRISSSTIHKTKLNPERKIYGKTIFYLLCGTGSDQ